MLTVARPPVLLVRTFTTTLPTLAKKKPKMPPKKNAVPEKKVMLGRPGNKCVLVLRQGCLSTVAARWTFSPGRKTRTDRRLLIPAA